MSRTLSQIFSDKLGSAKVSADRDILQSHARDWCKEFKGQASCILFPDSEQDIVEIIQLARAHKISIVPSGGRTGLSGGATATQQEAVVSCERLNKILSSNAAARLICCESGVTTYRVQEAAENMGLYFPLEFASQHSSQIGGNIATNVGGIHVVRYGNIRDWVLGLRVVTGAGEVLDLNGSLVKNQTGYNLCSLMIGSEGTLGIITQATLGLTTKPADKIRVICALDSYTRILELLERVRDSFSSMSAFEYFSRLGLEYVLKHSQLRDPFDQSYPHYVLVEIEVESLSFQDQIEDAFFHMLEEGLIPYVLISQNSKQARELLELRERIGEVLASHYLPHKNDISVPVENSCDFLAKLETLCSQEYQSLDVVVFGHIGDGNFHINIVKPETWDTEKFSEYCHKADSVLFDLVRSFSGSISAEHGVGLLKKDFLHFSRSAAEIQIMKNIKSLFDPDRILNPGKIFDL